MRSGNKLLDSWGKGGMVTPLVDVVFNLMITMFIFLMIYMAVIIPKPQRELKFASFQLPDAAPYVEYGSQIRVTNGSGSFTFATETLNLSAEEGVIHVDATNGLIRGSFLDLVPSRSGTKVLVLKTMVVDRQMSKTVPPTMAEKWFDGKTTIHLFFHEEWSTNARKRLAEAEGLQNGAQLSSTNTVVCHYAIRGEFKMQLRPKAVPFDPAENPLRLAGSSRSKGTVGIPLELPLAPLGGIEPYEYSIPGLPAWLKLDSGRASLKGTPPAAGLFQLTIGVKDGQTPPRDWNTAERLQGNPGHPLATNALLLEIEAFKPLDARLLIPFFGRVGEPFQGSVLATGGVGRRKFAEKMLPRGLHLNSDSGEISGVPQEISKSAIAVIVSDEHTNRLEITTSPNTWRGIIEPRPQRTIFGAP